MYRVLCTQCMYVFPGFVPEISSLLSPLKVRQLERELVKRVSDEAATATTAEHATAAKAGKKYEIKQGQAHEVNR